MDLFEMSLKMHNNNPHHHLHHQYPHFYSSYQQQPYYHHHPQPEYGNGNISHQSHLPPPLPTAQHNHNNSSHHLFTTTAHISNQATLSAVPPQSSSSTTFVAPVLINGVVLNPAASSSTSGLQPPPPNLTTDTTTTIITTTEPSNTTQQQASHMTTPTITTITSPSSPSQQPTMMMNPSSASASSQSNNTNNYLPPNSIVYNSPVALYPISCVHCRKQHKRCDRKLPSCDRCIQKGLTCMYKESKRIATTATISTTKTTNCSASTTIATTEPSSINPSSEGGTPTPKKRNSRKRKKNTTENQIQCQPPLIQEKETLQRTSSSSQFNQEVIHSNMSHPRFNHQKFYEEGLSKRQVIDCYYSFACDGFPLMDREDMEQCPENYLDYLQNTPILEENDEELMNSSRNNGNAKFKHLQELVALFLSVKAVCEMRCGMSEVAEKSAKLARNAICNYFDQHESFLVATTFSHLSQYEILNSRITNAKFYLQFVAFYLQHRFVQTAECDTNDDSSASSTISATTTAMNSTDTNQPSLSASTQNNNNSMNNNSSHTSPAEHDISQCRYCLSKMTQYEKNLENNRQYIDQSILSMGGSAHAPSSVDASGRNAKSFFDLSFAEGGFLREIPRYFTMFTGLKFPPQWITLLNQEISHKNCYDILKLLDTIFTFVKQHIKEKLSNPSNTVATTSTPPTTSFDSQMKSNNSNNSVSDGTKNSDTTPTPCFFQGNSQCLSLYEHMLDIVLNGTKIRILSKLGNYHSATSREIIEQSAYNITMSTQHDLFPFFLPYLVPFISAAALVHLRIVKMILNNSNNNTNFGEGQSQQSSAPTTQTDHVNPNHTMTTHALNSSSSSSPQQSQQQQQLERRKMFEELLEHSQLHTQHIQQQLKKNHSLTTPTGSSSAVAAAATLQSHHANTLSRYYEEILRKDLRAMHILARRFKLVSTQYSKLLREMEETLNQLDMMKQEQQLQPPQSQLQQPQQHSQTSSSAHAQNSYSSSPYPSSFLPSTDGKQQLQSKSSSSSSSEGSKLSPTTTTSPPLPSSSSSHSMAAVAALPAQFIPSFLPSNPTTTDISTSSLGSGGLASHPQQQQSSSSFYGAASAVASSSGASMNNIGVEPHGQQLPQQPQALEGSTQQQQTFDLIMMANSNEGILNDGSNNNSNHNASDNPNVNLFNYNLLGHDSQNIQSLMMNMIMMGGSLVSGLGGGSPPSTTPNGSSLVGHPTSNHALPFLTTNLGMPMMMNSNLMPSSYDPNSGLLANWNSSSSTMMEGLVTTTSTGPNNTGITTSKASSPQSSTVFDPFLTEEDLDMIFSWNHTGFGNNHASVMDVTSHPTSSMNVNTYAKMDTPAMHALLDQHLQLNNSSSSSSSGMNQKER